MLFAQFPAGPQIARAAGPNAIVALPDVTGADQCRTNTLPANDDGSTGPLELGFTLDFFGHSYGSAYVNNNGNVTFDSGLGTFTPFPLVGQSRAIVAPFFADVDTRPAGSAPVTYSTFGTATYLGHPTFCVDWVNVGYFGGHIDKLNSFQLLLVDRSDIGAGNFDIVFNYDQVQWETGDASGGIAGLGGFSARAGYSNGSTAALELAGSALPGGLLDGNATTGLVNNTRNAAGQLGRYVFPVRNGGITLTSAGAATNPVGAAVSFSSTLTEAGTSVVGRAVTFTVTGANARIVTVTSDAAGVAQFGYTGASPGTDTVVASFSDSAAATRSSAPLTLTWQQAGNVLTGVAQCSTVSPTGAVTTTILPGAKVTLLSDLVPVASTDAGPNGAYTLGGLAPNATYTVSYVGLNGMTCGVVATTTEGGAVGAPAPQFDRGNGFWTSAYELVRDPVNGNLVDPALPLGTSVEDVLRSDGWYAFEVGPDARITLTLDGPAQYGIALFGDLQTISDQLVAGAYSVAAINAGFNTVNSAGVDSAPTSQSPTSQSPTSQSPTSQSPTSQSPTSQSPTSQSPIGQAPTSQSPTSQSAYTTAQALGLIAFSTSGPSKQIDRRAYGSGGHYYARVYAVNNAIDASRTYTLSAHVEAGVCGDVTLTKTPVQVTGSSVATLIITNTARLKRDDSGAAADAGATMVLLNGFATSKLAAQYKPFAVVDLATLPGLADNYQQWDLNKTCAPAANVVVDAIHDVIAAYRDASGATLKAVAIAGPDTAVPFLRIPDKAEIGNESSYDPPVNNLSSSAASLGQGYFLSDDVYASAHPILRLDHMLNLPDIAIGRLVETTQDFEKYLAAYPAGGVVQPAPNAPALVTGYSFLADLAVDLKAELDLGGLVTQPLIEPGDLGPTNAAAWSADQLRAKLTIATSPHFAIAAVNAHFSANEAQAADNTLMGSTEIAAITDHRFENVLFLSNGCHSGYTIVNGDAVALTQPLDFSQALARQGATFVGSTGFAYGDTDFVMFTERLLLNTTRELRYGTGAVAIGTAVMNAKQTYVSQLPTLTGTDEKALSQLTLYGMPTWSINLPSGRGAARPTSEPSIAPVVRSGGLATFDLRPTFTAADLHRHDPSLTIVGSGALTAASYYDFGTGHDVLAIPYRPVLPRLTVNVEAVAASATTARGAAFVGADYSDESGFQPFIDVPATEASGVHPTFVSPVFWPQQSSTLSSLVGQQLTITPFAYRSSSGLSPTGTGRTLLPPAGGTSPMYRVYYSDRTPANDLNAALAGPIVIVSTHAGVLPGGDVTSAATPTQVDVTVAGVTAADVEDLLVTYTSDNATDSVHGHWRSCSLVAARVDGPGSTASCAGVTVTSDPPGSTFVRRYHGELGGAAPSDLRLFIQAVTRTGLVSVDTNAGAYFTVAPPTTTALTPRQPTSLALSLGTTLPTSGGLPVAGYGSSINAQAVLSDATGPLSNAHVRFALGSASYVVTTGLTGVASVDLLVGVEPSATPASLTATFADDPLYPQAARSAATLHLVVSKAQPAFSALSPIEYSDHGFVATLAAGGLELNERLVLVTQGTVQLVRRTDAYGRVFLDSRQDGLAPGAVSLSFVASSRYLGTSGSVTIAPEKASLTLTGAPQASGPLTFSGIVAQEADNAPGDLTRATVTFGIDGQPAIVATGSPDSGGSVSATSPGTLSPGLYTVNASISGYFTGGLAPTSKTTLPVYDPTKAVAGAGKVAAPNNQVASFAFATKYLPAPSVAATGATGGALAGPYRVAYSYVTGLGETAIGASAAVTVTGVNRAIGVARITGIPGGITAMRFYFVTAPAGRATGFVIQRSVSSNSVAAFTILSGPTASTVVGSAPTGVLALRVQNAATRATTAMFLVAGGQNGFDWLVITGSPSSRAVFEGTGTYIVAGGSTKRRFRVAVDKPANTFEIRIFDPVTNVPIVIGGTITPLPLEDEPARSGIVFR